MFSDSLSHRLSQLLYQCMEDLGSTKAALYLAIPGQPEFRLVSDYGWPRLLPPPQQLEPAHPLLTLLQRERQGVLGDDLAAYPELGPFCLGSEHPRFYVTPIHDRGETIGVLIQRDPSKGVSFSRERHERATQRICHAVAQALSSFLPQTSITAEPRLTEKVAVLHVPAPATEAMAGSQASCLPPGTEAVERFQTVPAPPALSPTSTQPLPTLRYAGALELNPAEPGTLSPEQRTFFWEAASLLCRMVPASAVALFVSDPSDSAHPILAYSRLPLSLDLKQQIMTTFVARLPDRPQGDLRLVSRSEWLDREAQQGSFLTFLPVLLEEQFGDNDLLALFRLEDRPFTEHEQEFISQVSRMLGFYLQEARLHERYHESFLSVSLRILASADGRLPDLRPQSVHTAQLSRDLARWLQLPSGEVEAVGISAILHDVGTLLLDRTILDKPSLSAADRAQVQTHPVLASTFLKDFKFPFDVMHIIRHHHESWDGRGYPDGLSGETIPLGSRIIHLVESYQVMTSGTSYKPPKPVVAALRELEQLAGIQFDPELVSEFIQMLNSRHL